MGRDLSVIGFDNEAVTADMAPPLTSMQLPPRRPGPPRGQETGRLDHPAPPVRPNRLTFDCQMISRASTGPLLVRQPA
ncbi:substrate-binding domain-containing protein [Tabrizicola sp.]|uniref:substrate-binding domain-containing protein n=1 Tax=Tabrizicola sp. TaxID=2005166 RepID=UPI0035258141